MALIVMLPRSEDVAQDREILRVVELCRPHSILPYHHEPNPSDLRSLLCRAPDDLSIEVTDYLAWRGDRARCPPTMSHGVSESVPVRSQ